MLTIFQHPIPHSDRITGYTPATTTVIDDIINERRKELFAEGHVAFDYWRNGKTFKCGPATYEPANNKNVLPVRFYR